MSSSRIGKDDDGEIGHTEISDPKTKQIRENLEQYEELFGVDEETYEQPTTTRRELWSYYAYCNGDNGVGPGSYSQALFQQAVTAAGHNPAINPIIKGNCTTGGCVLPWGNGTRSVSSIVLIANGICFAIMTLLFVTLGSLADYGSSAKYILLTFTVICWITQYAMITIRHSSQWPAGMILYIISYISYGGTLVFCAAIFSRLARYMPHVKKAKEELSEGRIERREYDRIESLEKNHISSVSTAHSNIGYLMTLVLNLSVLLPLQGNDFGNNIALCLTNTCQLLPFILGEKANF